MPCLINNVVDESGCVVSQCLVEQRLVTFGKAFLFGRVENLPPLLEGWVPEMNAEHFVKVRSPDGRCWIISALHQLHRVIEHPDTPALTLTEEIHVYDH